MERLCSFSSKFDHEFLKKVKKWAILDTYYVPTRYLNSLSDSILARVYTRAAAEEAANLADEIVEFVKRKLNL